MEVRIFSRAPFSAPTRAPALVAAALGLAALALACGAPDPDAEAVATPAEPVDPSECTQFWELGLPLAYMPKVTPTSKLNVRGAPSTDAEITSSVSESDTLFVQQKCPEWLQLAQESEKDDENEVARWLGGWISARYVCVPQSGREAAATYDRIVSSDKQARPAFREMLRNAAEAQRGLGAPDC